MIRKLTPAALALVLGACAIGPGGNGGGGRDLAGNIVSYSCDDDRSFTAAYDRDMESVSVGGAGDTHRLRLDDRDNGQMVYSGDGGDVRLTVDGDEASLRTKGDEDLRNCQARS
jgi:hypothetical protein